MTEDNVDTHDQHTNDQHTSDQHTSGPSTFGRRRLFRWAGAAGMLAATAPLPVVTACSPQTIPGSQGSDANGLRLPPGFTSRIIAAGGQPVAGTTHVYGIFPDGGATFVDRETPGGWYYVANHEVPFGGGGVTSFRFAPDGTIVDAYPICSWTSLNCAGGATPWGTWLTCEEFDGGGVWECDPTRPRSARRHAAMGLFAHEAAAVAIDDRVYLTEDRPDGGFYRFTPDRTGDLSSGLLEIACGPTHASEVGTVTWRRVPHVLADPVPCRRQVPDALHFDGGEGIATSNDSVWFTTKGDNRIWHYSIATDAIDVRLDADPTMLGGVDNLWVTDGRLGDILLVAEDGDDLQIVAVRSDNSMFEVVRVIGHPGSELAGPALSPDRTRLYFSSQRGPAPNDLGPGAPGPITGVTYEVTGPFADLFNA